MEFKSNVPSTQMTLRYVGKFEIQVHLIFSKVGMYSKSIDERLTIIKTVISSRYDFPTVLSRLVAHFVHMRIPIS